MYGLNLMKSGRRGRSPRLRPNAVFTFKEISLIFGGDTDKKIVASAINYYVKTSNLYRIR